VATPVSCDAQQPAVPPRPRFVTGVSIDRALTGSGRLVAERAYKSARRDAIEHDSRGPAVLERAKPDEDTLSGGAYVRAVLVGVDDDRRAQFRDERGEGAARLPA
jgi:hypothetical protein